MEPDFPMEFLVKGTPVSLQASSRSGAKDDWKDRVRQASLTEAGRGKWATTERLAATLFYFPAYEMPGDLDNIVKPILDALMPQIYLDDSQIDRLVVQRFKPENIFPFSSPSDKLLKAMQTAKPVLYVKLSKDLLEEIA